MLNEILFTELVDLIEGMDIDTQYCVYTEFCERNNYIDDIPYPNDEYFFNDYFEGLNPFEIAEKISDSDWDTSWSYFVDGIYGLEEWEGIEDAEVVAQYIIDYWEDLGNSEISDLIYDYEIDFDDFLYELFTELKEENENLCKEDFLKELDARLIDRIYINLVTVMAYYKTEVESFINDYFE